MTAKEWYQFDDPAREGITWRVDVTFLLSHWHCIYGRGCQGMYAEPNPVVGCCNHGAWFSGDEDRERVEAYAARLTPDQWQNHRAARSGIGRNKTRVVRGACIFLNHAGFPGGAGCALHVAAVGAGEDYIDWKPDVCWQVPLRYRTEDDGAYVIEEFSQATWGPGGEDFSWWCTGAPEVFTARLPVFRTLERELRRMMGDEAFDYMAGYLEPRRRSAMVHPSEQARRPVAVAVRPSGRARSPRY